MRKSAISAICLALGLAFAGQAEAQISIGGLKSKVKKEVKQKAKDKAEEAAEVPAASVSVATTSDEGFDPYRIFTPSEAAVSADRFANDETVKSGFTKAVGQIHATYEHLDEVYNAADGVHAPYQPYYTLANMHFYFTGTGIDDEINKTFGEMLMKAIAADSHNVYWITDYVGIDESNPAIVVPKDETFLNALYCQYIADPKSMFAFELMLKADIYINCFTMQCKLGMDDELNGMVDKNHILPAKFKQWRLEREGAAYDMASEYIPLEDMLKLANKYSSLYKSASDPVQKLMHFLVVSRLVDKYLPGCNGFSKDNDTYRMLNGMVGGTNTGELYDNAAAVNAEPVNEPKGVAVSADIRRMAESCAGKFAGEGVQVEKIIYLESKWRELKNPKWPYEVIAYGLDCAVVTVENGKRYIRQARLTKDARSSQAFMQAGTDSMKRPLK